MTHAADGDGVYTATSGHGPADDAVHGLAVQKGEDLPAGAILATGKRDAQTKDQRAAAHDDDVVVVEGKVRLNHIVSFIGVMESYCGVSDEGIGKVWRFFEVSKS